MPQPKVHPTERTVAAFKQLTEASQDKKSATHGLCEAVAALNDALEPLNIGVAAWHTIAAHTDSDSGYRWSRQIGYIQWGDSWSIVLKKTWQDLGDQEEEQIYEFKNAPAWMAIEGIAKLPDLLETLISRVQDTTKQLKTRTDQTLEAVAAIQAVTAELAADNAKK